MSVFKGLQRFLVFGRLAIRIWSPASAGKPATAGVAAWAAGRRKRGVAGACVAGIRRAAGCHSRSCCAAWTGRAEVRTSRLGFCRVVRAKRSSRYLWRYHFIFHSWSKVAPGKRKNSCTEVWLKDSF